MDVSTFSINTEPIRCSDATINELEKEELRQMLHSNRCELDRMKIYCSDLESEIEAQKVDQIQKFNEEKNQVISGWNSKVAKLELILDEEREQFKELHTKYLALSEAAPTTVSAPASASSCDHTALEEVIEKNSMEILELQGALEEKSCQISVLQTNLAAMAARTADIEKENVELRESLNCKSESLKEALNIIEELKNEKVFLSSELELLKSAPDELKRGNSLFSEVEDKRKILENKMELLSKKYLEAKQLLAIKTNECNKEKDENRKFRMHWENEEKKCQSAEAKLVESYKKRIDELTERNRQLEANSAPRHVITIREQDLVNTEWVQVVIDDYKAEAQKWKEALDKFQTEKLYECDRNFFLIQECTKLKRQAIKDQATIESIQIELETLKKEKSASNGDHNSYLNGNHNGFPHHPPKARKTVGFDLDVKKKE